MQVTHWLTMTGPPLKYWIKLEVMFALVYISADCNRQNQLIHNTLEMGVQAEHTVEKCIEN